MKRRADHISDAVIKHARAIQLPADIRPALIGDWRMTNGLHALVIAVPADTIIEIGDKK